MMFAWPQVVMLVWFVVIVVNHAYNEGKPYKYPHSVLGAALKVGLMSWLLYAGGFWQGGR